MASAGASPPSRSPSHLPSVPPPPAPARAGGPLPRCPSHRVAPSPPRCARTGHGRGVLPTWCPPSRPGGHRMTTAGVSPPPRDSSPAPASTIWRRPGRPHRQVAPPPPRRAQTGHSRGVLPVQRPPSRPGVRRPTTAGACGRSSAPPPAPACAHQPRPGRASCHVSPSRPCVLRPATAGACDRSSVPRPAPACAKQP